MILINFTDISMFPVHLAEVCFSSDVKCCNKIAFSSEDLFFLWLNRLNKHDLSNCTKWCKLDLQHLMVYGLHSVLIDFTFKLNLFDWFALLPLQWTLWIWVINTKKCCSFSLWFQLGDCSGIFIVGCSFIWSHHIGHTLPH